MFSNIILLLIIYNNINGDGEELFGCCKDSKLFPPDASKS